MEGWGLKEDKRITVIVPVYNAEGTLARCLESIQRQTYQNWEAVLVDDGSTDSSPLICQRYAGLDQRFVPVFQKHGGISRVRNAGVEKARGDYIAFVDADDYAEPQMLEKLYGWLRESSAEIAACGYYIEKGQQNFVVAKQTQGALLSGDKAMTIAMQRSFYQGFLWNKLFCARLFAREDEPWFLEHLAVCEDLWFLISRLVQGARLVYHAEPLYHYCLRPGSLTGMTEPGRMSELDARREILKIIPEGAFDSLRMAQCRYSETAAMLQYNALFRRKKEQAEYCKAEAARYAKDFYHNPQISLPEKGMFFLKHHAPRMAARINAWCFCCGFFFGKKAGQPITDKQSE